MAFVVLGLLFCNKFKDLLDRRNEFCITGISAYQVSPSSLVSPSTVLDACMGILAQRLVSLMRWKLNFGKAGALDTSAMVSETYLAHVFLDISNLPPLHIGVPPTLWQYGSTDLYQLDYLSRW